MSICRYLIPSILSLSLFSVTTLSAANRETCQSKIFDRFVTVERTEHKLPSLKPDNELKERMTEFEISCPWQVAVDFNSDRKRDWAGFVIKDKKYSLLAYISTRQGFTVHVVKQYSTFPLETHFDYIPLKEVALISSKPLPGNKNSGFALVENKIGQTSKIYLWNGSAMIYFDQFAGNY